MSQLTSTAFLLQSIAQDIVYAWGLTDKSIHYGQVELPQTNVPYAILAIEPIGMQFQGKSVEQSHSFSIQGFFSFPGSGNIELAKIDRANELIAQLLTGPNYKDTAYLPIISQIVFDDEVSRNSRVYSVSLLFECSVSVPHYTGAF